MRVMWLVLASLFFLCAEVEATLPPDSFRSPVVAPQGLELVTGEQVFEELASKPYRPKDGVDPDFERLLNKPFAPNEPRNPVTYTDPPKTLFEELLEKEYRVRSSSRLEIRPPNAQVHPSLTLETGSSVSRVNWQSFSRAALNAMFAHAVKNGPRVLSPLELTSLTFSLVYEVTTGEWKRSPGEGLPLPGQVARSGNSLGRTAREACYYNGVCSGNLYQGDIRYNHVCGLGKNHLCYSNCVWGRRVGWRHWGVCGTWRSQSVDDPGVQAIVNDVGHWNGQRWVPDIPVPDQFYSGDDAEPIIRDAVSGLDWDHSWGDEILADPDVGSWIDENGTDVATVGPDYGWSWSWRRTVLDQGGFAHEWEVRDTPYLDHDYGDGGTEVWVHRRWVVVRPWGGKDSWERWTPPTGVWKQPEFEEDPLLDEDVTPIGEMPAPIIDTSPDPNPMTGPDPRPNPNDPDPVPDPGPDPPDPPPPFDLCASYPWIIFCQEMGEGFEIELPEIEIPFLWSQERTDEGVCPDPVEVGILGRTFFITYDPMCQLAEGSRPIFVTLMLVLCGFWVFSKARTI